MHAACTEEPTRHCGRGERALGRTKNMLLMVVTRDEPKLSDWFNADAPCRVAQMHMEGDTGRGRREGAWGRCGSARSVHGGTSSTLGTAHAGWCAPETCIACP